MFPDEGGWNPLVRSGATFAKEASNNNIESLIG